MRLGWSFDNKEEEPLFVDSRGKSDIVALDLKTMCKNIKCLLVEVQRWASLGESFLTMS